MPSVEYLEGVVERVTYHNPENGYTVLRFQVEKFTNQVTAVGNVLGVNVGEYLRLQGTWTSHPKFGKQFQIDRYQSIMPATLVGLEKYLGSGLIKGVGPVTARRLVRHFGRETLRILEEQPERLAEVPKVGTRKADLIARRWQEQKEIQNVMIFLQGHGVSPTYAVKIYRAYGDRAVETVKENPYRMAREIWGIGFKTADKIAQQLGFQPDDPFRLQSGLLYSLNALAEDGHVFVPWDELVPRAAEILGVAEENLPPALMVLKDRQDVILEDHDDLTAVYLTPFYYAERGVTNRLCSLLQRPVTANTGLLERLLARIEGQTSLQLSSEQRHAILAAAASNAFVLTGGPGTGKTTSVRTLVALCEGLARRVLLASPTGRAAKRLSEVTGRPARTLHRMLEFSPQQKEGDPLFKRNQDNPLQADVIIVDEVSMVDLVLMNHLLKAVPPSAQLILVGDSDQLPSVGAGDVLRDIIASKCVPAACLTQVFRQAQRSLIVMNAHRIQRDEFPVLITPDGQTVSDCYFVPADSPEEIVAQVQQLVTVTFPRARFQPDDLQVLTPMNRGEAGANNLNTVLQNLLNAARPGQPEFQRGARHFRAGDRVIQLKNDYYRNVFNGDVGKVMAIDHEEQTLAVLFPDLEEPVKYDFSDTDELALAYALTVHKAQGSEYPAVIVVLATQHYMMLQKNLLYTALTRARRRLVLVGSRKAIAIALKNRAARPRYSSLAKRLVQALVSYPPVSAATPRAAEDAGEYHPGHV